MNRDEIAGFRMTVATCEEYFKRVIEAEKKMGPLSREEKIIILKTLGSAITTEELIDTITGKRILVVKDKHEKNQRP